MWWCLSTFRRLKSLPATTSDVPMKLSRTVEYFGFVSLKVFEANRHRSVAMPSTIAPANGDTYNEMSERVTLISTIKEKRLLAGLLNSLQMLCLCEFVPFPATRRIGRFARHNIHPWVVPTFSKQRLLVLFDPRPCLPCDCTDMPLHRPTLETTKS